MTCSQCIARELDVSTVTFHVKQHLTSNNPLLIVTVQLKEN